MRILYEVVAVVGALYFLLKKRRFDFLTIGYFSALMYFLPAVFGVVMSQYGQADLVRAPLIPETYVVMVTVILAILIGAIAYDQLPHPAHRHIGLAGTASAGNWALLLGIAGCVMTILTMGVATLMDPDKNVLLSRVNAWLVIWQLGGALAVLFFFCRRQWLRFGIALLLVLGDVFIGFRITFALTFIACFTLWAEAQGRQRFGIQKIRPIVAAASVIAFLFLYKVVYIPIKLGMWWLVQQRLTSLEAYSEMVKTSEPFVTQSILNRVLATDFHVPFDHFRSVLYQFMFFAPNLGAKIVSFNDFFQPQLFPNVVDMGMANNIWAEMWSSGGWPLLLLFIIFDVVVLCYLSTLLRIDNPELRAAIAAPAVTWAFYLHRNDVFNESNIIKRQLVFGAVCIVIAMLSHDATHRLRRSVRKGVKRVAQRRRERRLQATAQ
jgi:hypothetical protein